MGVPTFLLRKLYKRGSLRETADGRFAFTLQNPLATAHIVAPPSIVVNGVYVAPEHIEANGLDLSGISTDAPFRLEKGESVDLSLPGRLLRGGNRIHFTFQSKEFGELDFLVEDKEADFCEVPGAKERGDGSEE